MNIFLLSYFFIVKDSVLNGLSWKALNGYVKAINKISVQPFPLYFKNDPSCLVGIYGKTYFAERKVEIYNCDSSLVEIVAMHEGYHLSGMPEVLVYALTPSYGFSGGNMLDEKMIKERWEKLSLPELLSVPVGFLWGRELAFMIQKRFSKRDDFIETIVKRARESPVFLGELVERLINGDNISNYLPYPVDVSLSVDSSLRKKFIDRINYYSLWGRAFEIDDDVDRKLKELIGKIVNSFKKSSKKAVEVMRWRALEKNHR